MALHDFYITRGSEENRSEKPRRGMTMRMMPKTSVHDREVARAMHGQRGGLDMSPQPIFLVRGRGASGPNDFRVRPQRCRA